MQKIKQYTYLGVNGIITSPILLENIYKVLKYELIADEGKLLTKDGFNTTQSIIIPESDIDNWYEIDK